MRLKQQIEQMGGLESQVGIGHPFDKRNDYFLLNFQLIIDSLMILIVPGTFPGPISYAP